MYCSSCGKQNPEGAAFCAFCGKKMTLPQEDSQTFIEGELLAPEQESHQAPPASHQPYMRPDPSRLVTPMADNPAQPARRSEMRKARSAQAAQPQDLEAPEQPAQAAGNGVRREPSPYKSASPQREGPSQAAASRRETAARHSAAGSSETGRHSAAGSPETARHGAARDAAGRAVPERKAPVPPRKKAGWEAPSTLVPKRRKRPADDLFFEDVEPGDDFEEDDDLMGRRIKSAIAALCLLAVLGFVFWLLVLPGGQILRAKMGVGAPASAYAALGQQYLAEGSMKRAADAYYDALRLDPDNYDYALQVAQTQELLGDRETALAAYAKCLSLDPSRPEPYQAVAQIYQQMGDLDRAANALKVGYDSTGDLELLQAYQTLLAQGGQSASTQSEGEASGETGSSGETAASGETDSSGQTSSASQPVSVWEPVEPTPTLS